MKLSFRDINIDNYLLKSISLDRLNALERILSDAGKRNTGLIATRYIPPTTSRLYSSSLYENVTPSLMSGHSAYKKKLFSSCGAPLYPVWCYNVRYTYRQYFKDISPGGVIQFQIENSIISNTKYQIFQHILRAPLGNEPVNFESFGFDKARLYKGTNIYMFAFYIWDQLVCSRKSLDLSWDEFEFGYLYRDALGGQLPKVPILKTHIFVDEGYENHFGLNGKQIVYELPNYLSAELYKIELWALFYNVLIFLDSLKKCLYEEHCTLDRVYNDLRLSNALPLDSCNFEFIVVLTGKFSYQVCLPQIQSFQQYSFFDNGRNYCSYYSDRDLLSEENDCYWGKYKLC